MNDYETIVYACEVINRMREIMYYRQEFSSKRDDEAHYWIGVLDTILRDRVSEEDIKKLES